MVDKCTISRQSGSATDPDTGKVTPTFTAVYSGKCQVQQTIAQSSNPEAGGHQFTVQDLVLKVPVSVTGIQIGDTVTMSSAELDPELVGRVFRVSDLFHKTYATSRRLRVEEVMS